LRAAGIEPRGQTWVEEKIACDLAFDEGPDAARNALEGLIRDADIVVQPRAGRVKALLAADMDSTMINVECIDELADYAGVKAEVAAVTEQAMRGELDFEAALDARVALLRGLDEAMIDRLVRTFYARARLDPLIGPVFESRMQDWESHFGRMCAFWSSVALMSGRYQCAGETGKE